MSFFVQIQLCVFYELYIVMTIQEHLQLMGGGGSGLLKRFFEYA